MKRVKRARRGWREGREAEKCPKKDETSGVRQREEARETVSVRFDNELGLDFVDPSQIHFGK